MNKKLNILFIDDDPIEFIKFEKAVSLDNKHNILQINEAEKALLKLDSFQPNIIIVDINMPLMNGLEFLIILKKNDKYKHIPVVFLTTSNNENDIKKAYKHGVSGYINKPLKYDDYVKKIASIINYWSLNEVI